MKKSEVNISIDIATQVKLRGTNEGVHTHFHAG